MAAAPAIVKINYLNFDDMITNKFGIIVRNWPLKDFKCPGKINSLPDLQVLYHAWHNDVTTFYKMTPVELDEWRKQRYLPVQPVLPAFAPASAPIPAVPVPASPMTSTPGEAEAPVTQPSLPFANSESSAPPPAAGTFSGVFAVNGQRLVAKKPRQPRSDKGKKRGPNARTQRQQSSTE